MDKITNPVSWRCSPSAWGQSHHRVVVFISSWRRVFVSSFLFRRGVAFSLRRVFVSSWRRVFVSSFLFRRGVVFSFRHVFVSSWGLVWFRRGVALDKSGLRF